eukprot:Colp12_sorted_trinity150504_noHs@18280
MGAAQLIIHLSGLIHTNMPTEKDVFLIPSHLSLLDRHLLVTGALLYSPDFKYVDKKGRDVTCELEPHLIVETARVREDLLDCFENTSQLVAKADEPDDVVPERPVRKNPAA